MNAEETILLYMAVTVTSIFFMWIADNGREGYYTRKYKGKISLLSSKNIIFVAISFIILYSLVALRGESVGKDYIRYIDLYEIIGLDTLNSVEREWMTTSVGYWLFNRIMYKLGINPFVFFAILGFITLYYLYKGIIKQSCNWAYSLYLYICFNYYYLCFSMIRQMMAMTIVFYGYRFLKENKLLKYIFVVIIASLFHLSALICLVIWPLRNIKMKAQTVIGYILVGVIFFWGFDLILELFSWTHYVSIYSANSAYSSSWGMSTILNTLVRIIMLVFCLLFYKDVTDEDKGMATMYNIVALCTILQLGAMRFNLFGRITAYFYMAYLPLLPAVFRSVERKFVAGNRPAIRVFVIAFFAVYHFIYYFSGNGAAGTGYEVYSFV